MPAGNAVKIQLNPPSTAVSWRLTRNLTGVFADETRDIVYAGGDPYIVDIATLANGVLVYYKPWYWDGATWQGGAVKSATPASAFVDRAVDAMSLVRDRLDVGLNGLLARGVLSHPRGAIPVLTAYPLIEDAQFPIVTVHLQSDAAEVRGLGEMPIPDQAVDGGWDEYEGWLSSIQLEITGWSLNANERKKLRAAIKSVLIANLAVFDAQGLVQIDLSFSDMEDFQNYQSPIYYAQASFKCLAPSAVSVTSPNAVSSIALSNL